MASHQLNISQPTVESCVNALFKYKSAQSATTENLQLLPQDDYIYLNVTLNKIPSKSRTNPFKIPLTNPILEPTSQICLIVDDRPKSPTPPSDQIKKLIKSQNIPISKVIRISKLKTDYKPFEAKRKLCDSYDLFLVDKRVVHLLPKLIGKEFFRKKKLPLEVDLGKNLKMQVERALGSGLLYLRSGTCCVMKVGKMAMEKDEVVENVFDAIKGAIERVVVEKDSNGVRSLHLKFYDSVALPVYQAMPDVVKLKNEEKGGEVAAKISDSEGEVKKISGKKDGKSSGKNMKKKGRIHEVHYMDSGDDNVNESENNVNEVVGNLEEIDDDVEVDDLSVESKKRNKVSRALKEGEKPVKKKAKSEKKEEELVASGKKGKKKRELASEKITEVKDAKLKKRVLAK